MNFHELHELKKLKLQVGENFCNLTTSNRENTTWQALYLMKPLFTHFLSCWERTGLTLLPLLLITASVEDSKALPNYSLSLPGPSPAQDPSCHRVDFPPSCYQVWPRHIQQGAVRVTMWFCLWSLPSAVEAHLADGTASSIWTPEEKRQNCSQLLVGKCDQEINLCFCKPLRFGSVSYHNLMKAD